MPVTGSFYLKRLKMSLELIEGRKFKKILEIGYGSGIYLPELSKRADSVFGVDLHDNMSVVRDMLSKENVNAELFKGDILNLPFEDGSFDCVLCISILEHIKDLAKASAEIKRILSPGGVLLAGFPVKNKLTDALFGAVGFDFDKNHVSSHELIISALDSALNREELNHFPPLLPIDFSLYCAGRWVK
ncbi:MAG TPA: hypothetical protein DEE98_03340 [Elusimicrobia bacterium]|nr:hypothetical protein [Elusimicrobiota bacterium]